MELGKKLKMALIELNTTQVELAKKTGQSQQNLSRKVVSENFKIGEYERLVKALGCELEVSIILPNGKRI